MSTKRRLALFLATVIILTAHGAAAQSVDVFFHGRDADGQFGYSVADAGDVNNDGAEDIIIGAPLDSRSGFERGRAFIWFGGNALPILDLLSTSSTEQFGFSVAGIGDFNGDTIDDVAVGAPYYSSGGSDRGAVYLYFGGTNMDAVADLVLEGESADDLFGWSVSKGGNLDDSGEVDLLVGAPIANGSAGEAGAVYLFLGAGTPAITHARKFEGAIAGDQFGFAVSDVPDFKGDGTVGFLVGAPFSDADGSDSGQAYLFFGGSTGQLPALTPAVTFDNPSNPAGTLFGWSVSQAGYFSGPFRTDVVIGGPGHQGETGIARVYYGSGTPSSTPSPDLEILGEEAGDRFGEAVADVGDTAGSSRDDVAVGAPLRDQSGVDAGHVYIFEGGGSYSTAAAGTDVAASNPLGSGLAFDLFGAALSFAGDIDDDGSDDFLVGAPVANNPDNIIAGEVAIVATTGGIVPVLQVRFEQRVASDGTMLLSFSGAATLAEEATVWTVGMRPQILARLGDGLVRTEDELVARVDVASVADASGVELRWLYRGQDRTDRFEIDSSRRLGLLLREPVPNPFNPSTVIGFDLPASVAYELLVYDRRGRLVRRLDRGFAGPGTLSVTFVGQDDRGVLLASGVYEIVLTAAGQRRSTRAILVK